MTEPLSTLPDSVTLIEDACLYACVEATAKAWDARDKARDERDEALVRVGELEDALDRTRQLAADLESQNYAYRIALRGQLGDERVNAALAFLGISAQGESIGEA